MPGVRLRLFLTCWLVYVLHFATDFSREHYLVVSIVDDHAYVLDKYYGLHVDIFQNPPHAKVQGAHHGANPGISMVAAIPYFLTKPIVDVIVNRELAARRAAGDTGSAVYRDDRARRVAFYQATRRMGLDVRFGLVTAISEGLCMAPIVAFSAVLMFGLLGRMGLSQRRSLWLALWYGLGTPVFFRAGYLNQNLAIGVFMFSAFAVLWNPGGLVSWKPRARLLVAGFLGGLSFLCDYSGAVVAFVVGLYAWAVQTRWRGSLLGGFRDSLWYALGTVPGILMLWQYQWASFGNPFLPPQNWMAPVQWIDVGYQGVGGFTPDLFRMLLIDPSFGLFVAMPVAILALAAPWFAWREKGELPRREILLCLAVAAALVVFFSTVQYTRLQAIAGIRYLAPIFPFVFLAAVPALLRLPRAITFGLAVISVVIAWSMAMVRSQGTVVDNVMRAMIEGFQLPWLTVVSKMSAQYLPWLQGRPSALPWMALWAVLIAAIWKARRPFSSFGSGADDWH